LCSSIVLFINYGQYKIRKNVDLDSFNQHILEKTFRSQLNGQYQ
jgi:hypothetical protein